jgi:hypothetical protein
MRLSEHQAVTKADIPDAIARLAAIGAVTAAGPHLPFMASIDRTSLRANRRATDEYGKCDGCTKSIHLRVSLECTDFNRLVLDAKKI